MVIGDFEGLFDDLDSFKQLITFYQVQETKVNFVSSYVANPFTARCIVTKQRKNSLNPDTVDWSLRYRKVRSPVQIKNNTFFVHRGVNYIVKQDADLGDYGFYNAIGEEYKAEIPGVES